MCIENVIYFPLSKMTLRMNTLENFRTYFIVEANVSMHKTFFLCVKTLRFKDFVYHHHKYRSCKLIT